MYIQIFGSPDGAGCRIKDGKSGLFGFPNCLNVRREFPYRGEPIKKNEKYSRYNGSKHAGASV